jgi:hypothetical protein
MAETWSGNDSCGGGSWRRWTLTAVDNDDGNGGQQQWRTTKGVDNDGTRDRAAGSKGEGGEWAANNNGIRQKADKPAGQREREKIKKSSLRKKTFFSDTVCLVGYFTPAKTTNVPFLLYQS